MPKFLIPKDYSKWLPDEKKASDALEAKINQLNGADSCRQALEKKIFSGLVVFTIDVNVEGFHRLLFMKIEQAEIFYVLVGIALHHDYAKALRSIRHFSFSADRYDEKVIEVDEVSDQKMVFYAQNWISLSDEQAVQLGVHGDGRLSLTLPRMIVGPPGSGKSLVSVGFFQERALEHLNYLKSLGAEEERNPLRLLFVSPQSELNRRLLLEWANWVSIFIPDEYRSSFCLECKLPVELLAGEPEGHEVVTLNREEVIEIIRKKLKVSSTYSAAMRTAKPRGGQRDVKPLTPMTPEMLYDEYWGASHILNLDIASGKDFDSSSYCSIGVRRTIIRDHEGRKIAYDIYQQLVATEVSIMPAAAAAEGPKKIIKFSGLSKGSRAGDYDYVCADELQNCSAQEINNIFSQAKDGNFIGSFDPYQRADVLASPVESFATMFHTRSGRPLPIHQLVGTYRLSHSVATVCNEIILLMNTLQQGKDELAYSKIASLQELTEIESNTSLIVLKDMMRQAPELCTDANFAILVLNETDKKHLKEKTGSCFDGCGNIFSVDEARGLQFSKVVVYLPVETLDLFSAISKEMCDRCIGSSETLVETTAKTSRNAHYILGMLSRLMVAFSRSHADAWLCCEGPIQRDVKRFHDWLKVRCSGVKTLEAKASSRFDWLKLANQFMMLRTEGDDFALSCLKGHLGLDEDMASAYIKAFSAASITDHPMTAQEGLNYIASMQCQAAVQALVKTQETVQAEVVKDEAKSWTIQVKSFVQNKMVIAEGIDRARLVADEVTTRALVEAGASQSKKAIEDRVARLATAEAAGFGALTDAHVSVNHYGAAACLEAFKHHYGQDDLSKVDQEMIKFFAKGWGDKLSRYRKKVPEGLTSLIQCGWKRPETSLPRIDAAQAALMHAGQAALMSIIAIKGRQYGAYACLEAMKEHFKEENLATLDPSNVKLFALGWRGVLIDKKIAIPPGLNSLCTEGYKPS